MVHVLAGSLVFLVFLGFLVLLVMAMIVWDCEVCDGEVLAGSGMIMIPF